VAPRRRLSLFTFIAAGLAVAAALVILVDPRASSSHDGLAKVAADTGIDRAVQEHSLARSPFADDGTSGVDDAALGTLAGLVGVAVTFVVCAGLVLVVRRRRNPPPSPAPSVATPPA
jgi:hypothetical protein